MFEVRKPSVDCNSRPSKRFTFEAVPSSRSTSISDNLSLGSNNDKISPEKGEKSNGRSSKDKNGDKRPSGEKSTEDATTNEEKKKNIPKRDLVWIGKEGKKKKKKLFNQRNLSDEQLLDYSVKQKLQDMFIYIFFLIVATIVVLGSVSSSASSLSRGMTAAFMDTPFIKLADETPIYPQGGSVTTSKPTVSAKPTSNPTAPARPTKKPRVAANLKSAKLRYDRSSNAKDPEAPQDYDRSPFVKKRIESPAMRVEDPVHTDPDFYDGKGILVDSKEFAKESRLRNAISAEGFWEFMETSFINTLYTENWYSNEDPIAETIGEDRQVLFSSQLLGLPRLRQVRVRSDSCNINSVLQPYFNSCMTYYSSSVEDKTSIRPKYKVSLTMPAWDYTDSSETKAAKSSGKFSTYGPSGYYIDLGLNRTETLRIIRELRENQWVSRPTRAVILDFTLYNANVNLFLVCKIIFEMPPTGGMYPIPSFAPVKLFRYVSAWDFLLLGGEIAFCLLILYLTYQILSSFIRRKWLYLKDFSFILLVIVVVFGWLSISFGIYRYFYIEQEVADLISKHYISYPNFEFAKNIQQDFNIRCAFMLFFAWIRGILYLKYCEWIQPLFRTIGEPENRKSLFGLSALFFAMVFAMAQLGYLLFGEQSTHYQSLGDSVMALFGSVVGELNYIELEKISFFYAAIFLVLYIFLVFFILVMLFAAVTSHAYDMSRATAAPLKDRMVASYFSFIISFGRIGFKSKQDEDIINIKRVLSRAGFTDLETDIFFAKFGVKSGDKMTQEEKHRLIEKLKERKFEYDFITVNPLMVAQMLDDICRLKQKVKHLTEDVDISRHMVATLSNDALDTAKRADKLQHGLGAEIGDPPHDIL